MASATVAEMTTDELRDMLSTVVEEKVFELLGDPDEGLPVRAALRSRLLRQQQTVRYGERGQSFKDVTARLGLA